MDHQKINPSIDKHLFVEEIKQYYNLQISSIRIKAAREALRVRLLLLNLFNSSNTSNSLLLSLFHTGSGTARVAVFTSNPAPYGVQCRAPQRHSALSCRAVCANKSDVKQSVDKVPKQTSILKLSLFISIVCFYIHSAG